MDKKRKIVKSAAVLLSAATLMLFGTAEYYSQKLPEKLTADCGEQIKIAEYPEISCASFSGTTSAAAETFPVSRQATLALFGAIPVKNIEIREAEAPVLVAGGNPFGIKLLMDGVMLRDLGS